MSNHPVPVTNSVSGDAATAQLPQPLAPTPRGAPVQFRFQRWEMARRGDQTVISHRACGFENGRFWSEQGDSELDAATGAHLQQQAFDQIAELHGSLLRGAFDMLSCFVPFVTVRRMPRWLE